jgi:uncharacterized membrane protein
MVAIFLALIIIASLLAGYYLLYHPTPHGFSTFYVLDAQNKAENYPQLLVVGQNSTFSVPIGVVNNMGWTVQYQVQVKITTDLTTYPVNVEPTATYDATVANGQTWQKTVSVTENQPGNYWVVFELYTYNPADGTYKFTYDYGVLPINVVAQA